MIHINHIVVTTLCLVLMGCVSKKDSASDNSPYRIYKSAQQKLNNGDYKDAIKQLETLENCYLFGSYAQQIQLYLIYAYYKSSNFPLSQAYIDRFLRMNPTHPNIDYTIYMRGLTNMALDDNLLQSFFGEDRSDRDPVHIRAAFRDFTQLIQNHPKSKYLIDSVRRLVYLKDRLSKHEFSIVKYYDKRGAYVVVANRVEQMLRDFPDTQATRQALLYMEKAYSKLQLSEQARKVAKIIAVNPI